VILLSSSAPSFGREPATATALTLQDALSATLERSPALRIQQSVIEQKTGIREQISGAFDWSATGDISYGKDRTPRPGLPGTEPVDNTNNTAYTAGLNRLFRNGIYLRPSVSVGVEDNVAPTSLAYGVSELNLQVIVPLLRGLGQDSTGAAEAAARGDVNVAKLLYQHALSLQAFGTAANYWSCRNADDTLAVQLDVEQAAEKLVESTKVLVESGVFPPAYLLQAEANLREKRTVRINAELDAHEARFSLGQSLGLAPEAIATTPTPVDTFPALTASLTPFSDQTRSALIVRALQHRSDYLAVKQSLVPLNILTRQAELDLKPEVNLAASAGYKGLNAGRSPISPLGTRLTGLNAEVGISVAWPFKNTYQRGLLRTRRANQDQVEAEAVQLAQSVAGEVLLAIEQLRLRADTVRSAQETVQIAKRAVAAQYEQVRAGDGTILDVISLENLSAASRIRYINSHASYAIAIAQVRFALGAVFTETESGLTLSDLTVAPSL
jgi:outer membrane protein